MARKKKQKKAELKEIKEIKPKRLEIKEETEEFQLPETREAVVPVLRPTPREERGERPVGLEDSLREVAGTGTAETAEERERREREERGRGYFRYEEPERRYAAARETATTEFEASQASGLREAVVPKKMLETGIDHFPKHERHVALVEESQPRGRAEEFVKYEVSERKAEKPQALGAEFPEKEKKKYRIHF